VTLATHYGLLRGKAAAALLRGGDPAAQANVSAHYRNEGAVLREVVGEWYSAVRDPGAWKGLTADIARSRHGVDLSPDDAFRWLTNVENVRDEYDPFPPAVRAHIRAKLEGGSDVA